MPPGWKPALRDRLSELLYFAHLYTLLTGRKRLYYSEPKSFVQLFWGISAETLAE